MTKTSKIQLLDAGLADLARPFTPEEAALLRRDLQGESAPAELFVAGSASSTFDLAWHFAGQGLLPEWGAALALSQEAGRGQLRRSWYSPLGNLHVSFRLPGGDFFAGSAATVLLGLLFCEAFSALGLELKLKWPNDLVLEEGGAAGKLGGILLEERNGLSVAGVGINAAAAPARPGLREGAPLPPALLPQNFAFRTPLGLWLRLVRRLIMIYSESFVAQPHSALLRRAEGRLLWRGREVIISGAGNAENPLRGVLAGLSGDGGLVLLTQGADGVPANRVISSGSLACV